MIKRLLCLQAIFLFAVTLHPEVIIAEIMASNNSTLTDEDGEYSDWIEIENTGPSAVDLAGWYLTDDDNFDVNDPVSVWTFPSRLLAAHQRLIVFASGKDRTPASSGELHTHFKLTSEGEYLALVEPNGTSIATEFSPKFPPQQIDVSYGRGLVSLASEEWIVEGASTKILIPSDGSAGTSWTGGSEPYDDASWISGKTGVGYDAGVGASGFALIDSFDTLNPDALDGQNGWSATDSSIEVTLDPENVDNQVAKFDGTNVEAYKPISIPNGSTGTLFFRLRRDGMIDFGAGAANAAAPDAWSDFEAQVNSQNTGILNARDGGSYLPLDDFDDQTWYRIWIVIDNSNDRYHVYMQGGSLETQTLLDSGSQTEMGFRNNSAGALQSIYIRSASTSQGSWMIDDVYLAEGENRGDPTGGSGYEGLINPDGDIEPEIRDTSSSVYLRMPFEVGGISIPSSLLLKMRYDDGFIAYLNGTEVARRNAPTTPVWDSTATDEHIASEAIFFETIDITASAHLLIADQTNILAIHGLNTTEDDSDLLICPELIGEFSGDEPEMLYFVDPTPGTNNGIGYLGLVEDTLFSHHRGFYETPFDVIISASEPGATITYTTDGSTPSTSHGTTGTAPVTVHISTTTPLRAVARKDGYLPTNVDTQTYIFLNDVITQDNRPDGYPTTWMGDDGSGSFPADYEMDSEVTEASNYVNRIKPALLALPTISIVTDRDHLFNTTTGIYQRPQQSGSEWERPVSVEFIRPDGSVENAQIDAGIRIQGGHTRIPSKNPKHSFRLIFKSEYGDSKLHYNLFPDDPDATDEFDQLVLRGAGNQSWLHHNLFKGDNRGRAQYIRDQWAKDTQRAMGHPSVRNLNAHLYINGIYWGVYNPTERATSGFGESYLGGDKDDYVALNSGTEVSGDSAALSEFATLAGLAERDLTNVSNYEQLKELLDLESFTDYIILQQYGGNLDWDERNWYVIRNTINGKWHFICWDSEFIFIEASDNILEVETLDATPPRFWENLMKNDDYRLYFADRVQKHCFNDGLLTPDSVVERWEKRSAEIFEPLIAESARWGDYRRDVHPVGDPTPRPLYDPDEEWMTERERLMAAYFPVRTSRLIAQYRSKGYFPDLDAPQFSRHGGTVSAGHAIEIISTDGGTIYFTIDGSDPSDSPTAQTYSSEVVVNEPIEINARVQKSGEWSPLTTATFSTAAPAAIDDLVVSEIMYNQIGADDAEFIELRNISEVTIDLGGVRFANGIDFEFPLGTLLEAGSAILVVRDLAAFEVAYGADHPIAGAFANDTALDNGGELLTLVAADGTILQSFEYDDEAPWPTSADGGGYSLELVNPFSNPDHSLAASWQSSTKPGGDPEGSETDPFIGFTGDPFANEDGDDASALLEYALGTSDLMSGDLDDAFYTYLVGDERYLSHLANTTAKDVILSIEVSSDLHNWTDASSILEFVGSTPTSPDQVRDTFRILTPGTDKNFFRLTVELK